MLGLVFQNPGGVTCLWYVPGTWVTKSPGHMGYSWCMAWKETCVMSERIRLINDYVSGDFGISDLALE